MKIVQTKSKNDKVDSKIIWNKAGTKVGAKTAEGETLSFDDYPDWLNPSLRKITYRLTYEGGKLLFISPINGIFRAKFVELQHKDNEPLAPVAKSGDGKYGPWTQYQFRASLRIIEPDMNGMPVTLFLTYGTNKRNYIADNRGVAALAASSGPNESKGFLLLKEFLEATGAGEPEYKFKENLLPEWEKVAKKLNRTFSLVYQDGYISKIVPSDEEFDESEDEGEEEFVEDDEPEDEMSAFDEEDDMPF